MKINSVISSILGFLLVLNCETQALASEKSKKPIKETKTLKKQNKKSEAYERAVQLLKEKKLDEALEVLKPEVEDPSPEVLKLLANIYGQKKDNLQVIRAYEILLNLKPNDFEARTLLGEAFIKTKKLDQAIEQFKRAIKIYPKHRRAYEGLLEVYSIRKNSYESRQLVVEMERFFPDDSKILNLVCKHYAIESFYEKAIELCKAAIAANQKDAESFVYLGLMRRGFEPGNEGHNILVAAAKKFPKSVFAQLSAAETNEDIKNWEGAAKYYRNTLAIEPNHSEALLGLAISEFKSDNFEKSLLTFGKACKFNRKAYGELVKATGVLLQRKIEKWYTRFRESQDRCTVEK